MILAVALFAEVGVFECVDVGNMLAPSRDEGVELMSGIGERSEECSELQDVGWGVR